MSKNNTIYIAADHGGFALKEFLVEYLKNDLKMEVQDFGAKKEDPDDDFPDFIIPAAEATVKDGVRGIFICGSGIGACIAANKVKGMYAALAYNIESAGLAKKDDLANGLCLAGRVLTTDHAKAMVKKWLETEVGGERYIRRNEQIKEYENK